MITWEVGSLEEWHGPSQVHYLSSVVHVPIKPYGFSLQYFFSFYKLNDHEVWIETSNYFTGRKFV